MEDKKPRREVHQQQTAKMPVTISKSASLLSTAMLLSAAILPSFAAKVSADELKEIEQDKSSVNNINANDSGDLNDNQEMLENSAEQSTSETEVVNDSSEDLPVEHSLEQPEIANSEEAAIESTDVVDDTRANLSAARSFRSISPSAFIDQVGSQAKTVAAANNLYASVMIAQAILESGWGNSALSSAPNHNLFGIKGTYNGQSVWMTTQEVINGKWVTEQAQFRKYPSYSESLQDNARVLKSTSFQSGVYFYSGAWKSNTRSYHDATAWLTGRYATDPGYAGKLNNLIAAHNLTRFDTPGSGGNNGGNNNGGNNNGGNTNTPSNGTYTVVSGDTLSSIGRRFNVTVANLKAWNNLKSDMIRVGQTLKVSGSAGGNNNTNKPNPKPDPKPNPNTATHTVASGETLSSIGRRYNVTVANLKAWNNLKSDMIYVGQKLALKASNTGNNNNNGNKPNTSASTHTVASGETLSSIGRRYNVTVANLKAWNNLKSDMIYVGQKLALKGGNTGNNTNNNANKPNTGAATHTVASGETLSSIGRRYNVTVASLKAWNNLKSDMIYIGQKLALKGGNTGNNNNNASKPNTGAATHTVATGDTLSAIARRYNVTVANIKAWNNLKSDLIFVGQKLTLKGGNTGGTSSSNNGNKPTSNASTYTVASGDTLSSVARRYNVTVANIKAWNNLKSDTIYIGQKLAVKSGATGGTTPNNQSNTGTATYTVASGDTLSSVARRYNVTVANIKAWNNLKSDTIYIGQKLAVKGGATSNNNTQSNTSGTRYKVASGDTLWSIAQKHKTSVNQIKTWNKLTGDTIYLGQSLRVK